MKKWVDKRIDESPQRWPGHAERPENRRIVKKDIRGKCMRNCPEG